MRRILTFVAWTVLFITIGLAIRTWGFTAVKISGTSMNDVLRTGDVALVTRFDYLVGRTPDRMDVVQCRFENRADTYVKRVIGLPGDRIAYEGGFLSVNGVPLSEPYVKGVTEDFHTELNEDEYFVMGDNRSASYDSRAADMGSIGADAFVGRVRWILWPIDRFGPVY